jgi:hypothetical protein
MKKLLMIPAFLMAFGAARAQEGDSAKSAAPAASHAPTADAGEELTKVKGQVDGLNESYLETKTVVDKLAKLKISGYTQVQWQHADSNGIASVAGGNFPGTSNQRLQIRRGRLKASYNAGTSQYIAEIEILPSGVSLKDAEIVLIEPWLKTFSLFGGVMDRPFGFEVGYSSSAIESPERSRLAQTIFPGEKDLGVKLEINPDESMGALSWFNLKAGAYTGTAGGSAPGNVVALSPTKVVVRDSALKAKKDTVVANLPTGRAVPAANGDEVDSTLDIIGRLGFKLPFNEINLAIDGGVSGYYGKSLSGNDTVYQMNGKSLGITTGNRNKTFVREAYGADLQLYYDLPVVGGLCLRGEYVQGTMPGTVNGNRPYGTSGAAVGADFPNSYMASRSFNGWYATWVQNFGAKLQSVLRYDMFDPNTDIEGKDIAAPTAANRLGVQDIAYTTFGLGLVYHWDSNFKFTAYYDMVTNEEVSPSVADNNAFAIWKKDLKDNVFTFRGQMKF